MLTDGRQAFLKTIESLAYDFRLAKQVQDYYAIDIETDEFEVFK